MESGVLVCDERNDNLLFINDGTSTINIKGARTYYKNSFSNRKKAVLHDERNYS